MRSSAPALALAIGTIALVGCNADDDHSMMGGADPAMGMMNETCPVMNEPVDPDGPTVTYQGQTIGFCCPGCVDGWKNMSESQKQAFVAKHIE